jgi:uncharacterized protein
MTMEHMEHMEQIADQLNQRGHSSVGPLLSPDECGDVEQMWERSDLFRSTVVMQRHNFGMGEYRYFSDPLPPVIQKLRTEWYARLAPLANSWNERMGVATRFPSTLAEFLTVCTDAGQHRPTPLLLRYEVDDYNCLHQDLYGEVAFPLQLVVGLSDPTQYVGGQLLLVEQRPRMQSRGESIAIAQGHGVVFPNRYRPVRGTRGDYRVNVRHGVSTVTSGHRVALGIIFHNAT